MSDCFTMVHLRNALCYVDKQVAVSGCGLRRAILLLERTVVPYHRLQFCTTLFLTAYVTREIGDVEESDSRNIVCCLLDKDS